MQEEKRVFPLEVEGEDNADENLPYIRLRYAANTLAFDFTYANCSQFEPSWRYLLAYLESYEPSLRSFALQCIGMASKSISRTLISSELRQKLVSILIKMVAGDEVWQNRCLAARILGESVSVMLSHDFPAKLRKFAFQTVLTQLSRAFPADLDSALKQDPTILDNSHYVPPHLFRCRIHFLHAAAYFFECPEALTPDVLGYVDRLISCLLGPKVHHYLQAAAIHAIHAHLPVTNRNRIRVEKLFRKPIVALSQDFLTPDGTEPETGQPPKQALHPIITKELALFWAVWYQRPKDSQLVAIVPNPEQMSRMFEGYAFRRWQWLVAENFTIAQDSQPHALDVEAKRNALRKTIDWPQSRAVSAMLNVKLFAPLKTITVTDPASDSPQSMDNVEEPDETFDIPDPTMLTFSMNPPILLFNRYPFQKDIFLQNKSVSHDTAFRLQVGPARYFQAWPTIGILPKGESTVVTVRFTPCPHIVRKNPEVAGFIRIRTADGLPMERISLRAYNMPAVKVYPQILDFGMCPKGDHRVMNFTIANLLPIDCPIVMLTTPSASSSMFQISPTQTVLMPKERKLFQIKFCPTMEGVLLDQLLLVAFGGEVYRIRLDAVCGEALHILDTKLDFGPTDIYYNAVVKRVTLKNRDKKPLPVSFEASTDELKLNKDVPIVLAPYEEKRVEVEFLSSITGSRQESLTFQAPHTLPHPIEILAFSGPAIWVPVMENIIFPSTPTFQGVCVQIPLVNLTNALSQCLITVPVSSPFNLRLVDPEFANRKPASGGILIEAKSYEGPDCIGMSLTIGARLTAVIEVEFLSTTWGSFKTPLSISMVKPRKWLVTTMMLNAIAVNELYLSREKPTDFLRRFLANPSAEPATGLLVKRNTDARSDSGTATKTSEIFELDPPLQTVFGAHLSGRFEDVCEFVTITNITSVTQRYHIVLSEHFYTDMPLDGELEGMASIEILLRLDTAFFDEIAAPEALHHLVIGSITIFDENEKKLGMVSSALHGIMGDLVSFECRESVDTIKYPSLKVMEKFTRRFLLRNRAPFEVVWDGRLISVGQQGVGLQADGLPMIVPTSSNAAEWCPFSLSVPRVSLKPFEFYTVDITFQATSSGEYRAKLFMEYVDPVTHVVNAEHLRGKTKRSLRQLLFYCSVGNRDLAHNPEILTHGDTPIGESQSCSLTLINNQPLNMQLALGATSPFRLLDTWASLGKQSKWELPVFFEPVKSKAYSDLITLCFGGVTRTLSVLGTGGRSGLESNLAQPIRTDYLEPMVNDDGDEQPIMPSASNIIRFGFVELGHPKNKIFVLTNTGTFDYVVKNITLSEDQCLTWKFLEDSGGDNSSSAQSEPWSANFGSEKLDDIENDWDEIDYRARETGGTPSSRAGFDRGSITASSITAAPRRRRYKSISHSMVPTGSSKLFPFRLPPYQKCGILLTFAGFEKGERNISIKVEVERSSGEPETYMFWVSGNLQPALQLWEKKIEYGVRAVHVRHKAEIKFTNTGTVPLPWSLTQESTKYIAIKKFDPAPLPKDLNSIPSPISYFPNNGKLLPGCTQSVDIAFTPSLAQYEVFSYFTLRTEDFAEAPIIVHGVGASSRLTIDVEELDFGVIRVGTNKAFKLSLRNKGILPLKYFVECSNIQFAADPEQGLLDGDGRVDITVKFTPKTVGQLTAFLRILPHSAEGYNVEPLMVSLRGMGSYPELVVLTRTVDFGTALFMTRNVQPVKVQNKGAAEAHIVFSCHHPGISLDGGEKGVTVGPHTVKDINIVYTPQVVEVLNVKAFLRSSDSRGDHFMLTLDGSVGVPKLTFEPTDILENLDFGVCAVNGIYKKTFKMANEGNISLPYALSLAHMKTVQHDAEGHAMSKPNSPRRNVINIEPSSGILAVGEVIGVTITFIPDGLAEYEYNLNLNYEFRTSTAIVKGTGGRAVLKIDSPLRLIDFGICRLRRVFKKPLTISNTGNLGVEYHLRPEPTDGDWTVYKDEFKRKSQLKSPQTVDVNEQPQADIVEDAVKTETEVPEEPFWVSQLAALGFTLKNPNGYCKPYGKTDIIIQYSPSVESLVATRLRVYFGEEFEDVEICGRASVPRLTIYGPSNELLGGAPQEIRTVDLGVHPINSEHVHTLQLRNDGPFGVDYLVQPIGIREFDVQPLRGFILPGISKPLRVYFRPNSENKFQTTMKVLWEKEPLRLHLVARGGIGKLEIVYADEKDLAINGLDFGMVPFNSSAEKHFFLYNVGMVEISMQADIDNDEYAMSILGDPTPYHPQKNVKPQSPTKRTVWNWYSTLRTVIPPGTGVEVVARFIARSPTVSAGNVQVRSEGGSFIVPMRGKGGTIQISHKGDLNMGDIATNYTYSRKIVIVNSGSIPSSLTAEWLVVGHSSEPSSAFIQLADNFTALDPRSRWAKQQLCRERGVAEITMNAKDRWRLIALMIRKAEVLEDDTISGDPLSKLWGSTLGKIRTLMQQTPVAQQPPSAANTSSSLNSQVDSSATNSATSVQPGRASLTGGPSQSVLQKKGLPAHYSAQFKRRQMFFHLITNTQLTSQSLPTTRPYIKVEPATCILPSYGEVTLNVEINLATEDTFLATLVIRPSVLNTPPHEISLTATPKAVNIVCDDTRILNFHRQPLGESEIITRAFTNVGHKDVNFRIINPNAALNVYPIKGSLKIGQTVTVRFTFKPVDESLQTGDVIFEPDISQPIRLKMYGGGGHTKASLSRYRRFDFGHCMIGKDTVSFLPITNEGNAILHLTRFELLETDTFFKGLDWPTRRVSLFPGKMYNLPIVFNPHEESPAPGRLVVGTNAEAWEIELIGLGREAVLIVSKVALEFSECLIGNSYEQKLGLKNVGDVNYPVTFKLEKEFPDIEFIPPSLIINPFSESEVIIAYTPSRETKSTVVLTVSSPYSTHKVPLVLHAGTAHLQFVTEELDFGMFERTTTPSVKLAMKNIGTVRTSYSIRDVAKPSMFSIAHGKGILQPGKSVEVVVTHIKHEVAQFEEKLAVRTDLIDKIYYIKVKGQCEEAILHAEEFNILNMGTCPVLENTSKPVSFTNYGCFPLEFSVKSAYPLKVAPVSGIVPGGETGTFRVTWNPSGGYELRTHVSIMTNIGNFNIVVRGKAAFPELAVKNMYLDFGVCAIGHMYKEAFAITNKGKVPVNFSILPPRESTYSVSTNQGSLEPKETKDVEVFFKPTSAGRFAHTFTIECKGINNKEIVVVGVGGGMKLEFSPSTLDLGRCPCELYVYHSLLLTNKGDVTLYIAFKPADSASQECSMTMPEPIVLKPNRTTKCFFGVMAKTVGPFNSKIAIHTKEKSYAVNVTGIGIRIVLTQRSKEILEGEKLTALTPPGPLGKEISFGAIDDWLKRLGKRFKFDTNEALHAVSQLPVLATDDSLKASLSGIKTEDPKPEPVVEEDPLVQQILDYPKVQIRQIGMEPIVQINEPDLDIDLDLILGRPPPFKKEEKIPELKIENVKSQKRDYMTSLPLQRWARNARTVDSFKERLQW
ncbi:uncharacterized protein SPPG_08279 [Spizellomyces punctatus DAOM BR117]|uniref:HYDIN/VesB/CFA65-like Ig-like domain-containing protein n=1 Tax=Spizellomyces punctatus (strain DAOM BR117) TaxID=645134 RepID=A0A0L0H4E3_SPIPD|nr:uncharacterized protein SPPG_08279 [Spizellomyces punctatus DAOM BR117]KNC96380.1 hypothetical protein SPPG_08279 [Spizellomyces punctatus DAOM BR117]|eukprot:XP_016604420.1 hypothetical protein SPPG_08279 [Spizellomyces punctatus DAOM BR117]